MAGTKVLVVATVPPDEGQLRQAISGAEEIRVVAPATDVSWLKWLTNDEDDAREQARETADRTAAAVEGEASVQIDRTSQDTDAAQAIKDALRNFAADEIVVVTRPGEDTTWLDDEAVRAAIDAHGIPSRHLELTPS